MQMKVAAMDLLDRVAASETRSDLFAVVMAGGSGSRLWPESRKSRPKPFLPLLQDGRTLFEATLDRLDGLVAPDSRFVVVGRRFAQLVAAAKPQTPLNPERTLLEPVGRDTALCVAWGALEALRLNPDPTLIALPADPWINDPSAFRKTLAKAVRVVDGDPERLVALGIAPTEPSPEYGYIKRGAPLDDEENVYEVEMFREKPTPKLAQEYLDEGRFFWNAGVGIWKARRYLELLRRYEPGLAPTLDRIESVVRVRAVSDKRTEDDIEFIDAFTSVAKENAKSFDYAVLERAPKVCVVLGDAFEWSDVGSFSALERLGVPSPSPVKIITRDAKRNYVRVVPSAAMLKVVALVGVNDLVVDLTNDALTIAKQEKGATVESVSSPFPVEVATQNAKNNDVRVAADAASLKVASFAGVDDLIVVMTGDALMIAKKGNDAAIKTLVEKLQRLNLEGLC